MTMGSFLLPSDPASNSAPPVAGSRAGSATAALASAVKTTAATPPPARRRDPSRRPRIAMHPGVYVRQQAHVLHLHPAKILDALRDLGQEVAAELLERVRPMSDHVAGDQVSDAPEGGAHHDEQRGAHPFPSHGRSSSGQS